MALRDNPVRTALPLAAALAYLGEGLMEWLIASLPAAVPAKVSDGLFWVGLFGIALLAERAGAMLQRHYTEPKAVLDEIIARMQEDGRPFPPDSYPARRVSGGVTGPWPPPVTKDH